ncbi:NAD(P)/FAD-dependent oxidoreductase [Pikeienuella sp. HZG-20]|uniref:NAD(P)/FAD-dependent oxidoreductase n=1 Tax=Paludibacillus litoralis TaxID=3133267 RepID=UPI0030EC2D24
MTDERAALHAVPAPHVVIVGAGVVGAATAIWLQRSGARVTLIDREGPAAGASWGNAGVLAAASVAPVTVPGLLAKAPAMLLDPMKPLFLRWSYLPRLLPFLRAYLSHADDEKVERISIALTELLGDAAEQHLALAAETGAERFVKPGDYLFGYASRAAFKADAYAWRLRARRGFAFEELDAEALAAFDPALDGRLGYAVRCPGHGMISDPGAYVQALHAHVVASGGAALTATVTDIRVENGRATGVVADGALVEADDVVLTSGAWSGSFAKTLGVRMPLETERGYHIEFHNPSIRLRAPVMVAAGKFVATPMEGRLRCAGVVEFGGLAAPPRDAPFRMIEKHARALFPDLKFDEMTRWMGHRPATADSLPVIGRAPAAANVWLGYGHQHVGMTAGPKTGRWLARMILGDRPNIDMRPFAPDRPARMKP